MFIVINSPSRLNIFAALRCVEYNSTIHQKGVQKTLQNVVSHTLLEVLKEKGFSVIWSIGPLLFIISDGGSQ